MPEEKETTGVEVELVGPHLRVDARPAQLVAQLRGSDGGPVLTARPVGGATRTESVPTGARQVTFRVSDELSVEATRGADFVALAGDGGRRVVVAFTGEVTVLPAGDAGDRFALAAHEAFLLADHSAEPKVVPVAALSEQEQADVTAVVEAAATAVLAPVGAGEAPAETPAVPAEAPAEVPTETPSDGAAEAPAEVPTETPSDGVAEAPADAAAAALAEAPTEAAVEVPPPGGAAAAPSPVAPQAEPAQKSPPAKKAAPVPARGAKKGKKGKGRPQPAKKSAPLLVPAAGGGGKAAKTVGPVKKAAPPVKKAAGGGPGKGTPPPPRTGGGGGGAGDESYDERPGDRRVLVVTMVLGLLGALVLSVFLLTGESEERDPTAAPTTTAASEGSTTTAATATSAPAAATTTRAPTTTAPATTTSTAPAPVAKYDIEPKSCVQSGSSITYTGTITNKSAVPFDYTIAVVFKDANGATIATANATVSRLAPDKATDFTTTATGSGTPTSCDVSAVEARPSR